MMNTNGHLLRCLSVCLQSKRIVFVGGKKEDEERRSTFLLSLLDTRTMKAHRLIFTLLFENMARTTRSMASPGKIDRHTSEVTRLSRRVKRSGASTSTSTAAASADNTEALSSNKKRKNGSSNNKEEEKGELVERTESFQPVSHLTYNPDSDMKIHTLILGTHPSIKSLAQSQYYGHPLNTFWWIAGDNLGFRRDTGISPSSGKQYQLTQDLLYSNDHVIPYEEQLQRLTSNGFALWDVLQSCKRKGSLDCDIKEEQPNKIREFCDNHPSIRRLVLCNGSSSAVFFNRHFKDWWMSGQLKPGLNKESIQAFQKYEKMRKKQNEKQEVKEENLYSDDERIECICGIGVSPAAAKYTYVEKRDFYKEFCYGPGLEDHKRLNPE